MRTALVMVIALAACGGDDELAAERLELEAMRQDLEAQRRELAWERQQLKEAQQRLEDKERQLRDGLTVSLPVGAATQIDPAAPSLVVVIPVSGSVVVQGQAIPDDDLAKLFRSTFEKDRNTQVILQTEKGTSHGRVVNVMELAKKAGLTRLAIKIATQ